MLAGAVDAVRNSPCGQVASTLPAVPPVAASFPRTKLSSKPRSVTEPSETNLMNTKASPGVV
eukprot:3764380-Rhodomonas_salina.1